MRTTRVQKLSQITEMNEETGPVRVDVTSDRDESVEEGNGEVLKKS